MDLSHCTDKLKQSFLDAKALAESLSHQYLEIVHLLKVFFQDKSGIPYTILKDLNINVSQINDYISESLNKITKVEGSYNFFLGKEVFELFKDLEKQSTLFGDQFYTIDVCLISALRVVTEPLKGKLKGAGLDNDSILGEVQELRKGRQVYSQSMDQNYDALKKYSQDLTNLAEQGKLDPVIGRDEEIRRTLQVLSRRTKNNPVLIGAPGVGKTAIVEGLAQRIISGDIPLGLKNTKVMSLDIGSMLAGAKLRGEFEERLKAVLHEVIHSKQDIILFIDELHNLMGAGKAEGSLDASNMLKPSLARGDLHCIGATTTDEYKKYIEKDAAFARRFQPVFVEEPTIEQTISILRGVKERYELHHGIQITDEALIASCLLSKRYITDRYLPDKAVDLMDEACSYLKIQVDSKPEKIDKLERKIVQMKLEREMFKREDFSNTGKRLKLLEESLDSLQKRLSKMQSRWKKEKEQLISSQNLKEQIDDAKNLLEGYQRKGNLEKASEIIYGLIPKLESDLANYKTEEAQLIKQEVTEQDVAEIVGRWTGIPVKKMLKREKNRLLNMENNIKKRIVGQDHAISALTKAIQRSRVGIIESKGPIGCFLCLGPTGVGKTEMAKAITEYLFDSENHILRFDMSEYSESHSIAKLIGAPPGYVGYEQGGLLTDTVRRRPYQVILFDEIEKAHRDILNLLLQVFDDGILTDSQGKKVDFKNTIILLTSNLGSQVVQESKLEEFSEIQFEKVMQVVRKNIKPEFLNRLDEILLFKPLNIKDMEAITALQLNILKSQLSKKNIHFSYDHSLIQWLIQKGFDPYFGARPLNRVIQKEIHNLIAEKILKNKNVENLFVAVQNNKIHLSEYNQLCEKAS